MPNVEKSKYFYRGRSQIWKTWKFQILTPCARVQAYRHQKYILQFQKWFQQWGQTPQNRNAHVQTQNPLALTVYPLQGGKVHPNLKTKKISEKKFSSLHYDQNNTLNPFLNPLTIKGDICNFVTAVSGQIGRNAASTTRRVGRYFALGYVLCSFF